MAAEPNMICRSTGETPIAVRDERDNALQQLAYLREAGQRFVDGELSVDGFEAALTDAYDEAVQWQKVPKGGMVAKLVYCKQCRSFRAAAPKADEGEPGDG